MKRIIFSVVVASVALQAANIDLGEITVTTATKTENPYLMDRIPAGMIEKIEMVRGSKASDMGGAVDEIAKLKSALTKMHLKCIETVRNVLDEKQRKTLLGYASKKMEAKH